MCVSGGQDRVFGDRMGRRGVRSRLWNVGGRFQVLVIEWGVEVGYENLDVWAWVLGLGLGSKEELSGSMGNCCTVVQCSFRVRIEGWGRIGSRLGLWVRLHRVRVEVWRECE